MPEHTPKPWKAEGLEIFGGREAYSVSAWDTRGEYYRRIVAELPCEEPTGEYENGEPIFGTEEANARLIAAAPELLECLEERVAAFWGDYSEKYRETFRRDYPEHPLARAEHAIARAKGGSMT